MNATKLWCVIGRGTSPEDREVSLVVNNVPAATQQEAAHNAAAHWAKRGATGYHPKSAARVANPLD